MEIDLKKIKQKDKFFSLVDETKSKEALEFYLENATDEQCKYLIEYAKTDEISLKFAKKFKESVAPYFKKIKLLDNEWRVLRVLFNSIKPSSEKIEKIKETIFDQMYDLSLFRLKVRPDIIEKKAVFSLYSKDFLQKIIPPKDDPYIIEETTYELTPLAYDYLLWLREDYW